MSSFSLRLAATLVLVAALGTCEGVGATEHEQDLSALPPGTRKMQALLESVINGIDPLENVYLSEQKVEQLTNALLNPHPPQLGLRLRLQLATVLLIAGESQNAIDQLLELRKLGEESDFLGERGDKIVRDFLAIAYLRLGEQENCLANHTIDSCLMPIQAGGVHQRTRGSRNAVRELLAALEKNPEDLISRWLLNIAYMTLGEYPDGVPAAWLIPEKTFASDYDIGRFHDVAPALGLDVVGLAGGAIMEDFDGDGFLDIMASSSGLRDPLRYFRNNGDGTFTDLTESAGLLPEIKSLNILQADYDNDGRMDVLMLRGAWMHRQGRYPNSLLRNLGNHRFEDVTEAAGILSFHPTQNAAWGDYDNDGWLDLFIGNESDSEERHASELFHNNRDGTFSHVASQLGLDVVGYVKGCAWGDYNNDNLPDLYVTRLGQPNLLFRNDGAMEEEHGQGKGWKFTDVTLDAGVAEPLKAFATWFWDFDNDGWLDLFAAGYDWELDDIPRVHLGMPSAAERHRLYRNNGDGTFTDVSEQAQFRDVILAMAANFGDLDNDGWLDSFFGTGEPDYRSLMPNRMLRNVDGKWFQDVTTSGGFGNLQKGHGIAFGDIDNDGDQDIYQVLGGAYAGDRYQNVLFENPGHGNHWLTLILEGVETNRAAMGARIRVRVKTANGSRDLHRTVGTGGSFGASSMQTEIGLGKALSIEEVEVRWPVSGSVQRFKGLEKNQVYRIREGSKKPTRLDRVRFDLSPAKVPGQHHHPDQGGDSHRPAGKESGT